MRLSNVTVTTPKISINPATQKNTPPMIKVGTSTPTASTINTRSRGKLPPPIAKPVAGTSATDATANSTTKGIVCTDWFQRLIYFKKKKMFISTSPMFEFHNEKWFFHLFFDSTLICCRWIPGSTKLIWTLSRLVRDSVLHIILDYPDSGQLHVI